MNSPPSHHSLSGSLPEAGLSRGRAFLLFYGLVLMFLGLDQISKLLVLAYLPFGIPQPVLGNWFYFTQVHNIGAAFSILEGQKLWLSLIAGAVSIWILRYAHSLSRRHPLQLAALACILAGALGNLTDRLRLGYVVDFLDLHAGGRNIWPIFNVADMCINLGVGLLLLYFWRYEPKLNEGMLEEPSKEERSIISSSEASIKEI
ncbi:MAG: signal peptidase II [Candidatus Melainabacteria bacterium HGW-Melainabacteria-1]|nr:MAG: signal peptidase II [Candidatus Melainabacteria bacterium HGW-Melainabacteria-1]